MPVPVLLGGDDPEDAVVFDLFPCAVKLVCGRAYDGVVRARGDTFSTGRHGERGGPSQGVLLTLVLVAFTLGAFLGVARSRFLCPSSVA